MKHVLTVVIFSIASACFSGCLFVDGSWTMEERLSQLKVGMTQDEVRAVCGDPVCGKGTFAANPNVWYYYTGPVWADFQISSDECQPVCFDPYTHKMNGWGYPYYNREVRFVNPHKRSMPNKVELTTEN